MREEENRNLSRAALFPSTEAVTLSIYLARVLNCSDCMICGKENCVRVPLGHREDNSKRLKKD